MSSLDWPQLDSSPEPAAPLIGNGLPASLISLVLHMVLVIVLGSMLLTRPPRSAALLLSVQPHDIAASQEEPLQQFQLSRAGGAAAHGRVEFTATTSASSVEVGEPTVDRRVQQITDSRHLAAAGSAWQMPSPDELNRQIESPRRRSAEEGGVLSAAGATSALDGVLGELRGQYARDGNLLLVWLFDASISLVDDRREVAARLAPFYDQVASQDRGESQLVSVVAAFGNRVQELQKPTTFGDRVVEAVGQTPVDTTGIENTMTAVHACVRKYREQGRYASWAMSIVVWTDESSDDYLNLEETIELCREKDVVVHVVGPQAVLGSQQGTHLYTDPGTGFQFLLPVLRGPDTSLPERLMAPYWFESVVPEVKLGTARVALGVPEYGGPYREGMLSGFGPFALTRLALETSGTFTLLDRPGDDALFDLEDMQPYFPDYRSAEEYIRSVQYSVLRQAVSRAALVSYTQIYNDESLQAPPRLAFFARRRGRYPFDVVSGPYMPPAEFRSELRSELAQEMARCKRLAEIIEQALGPFEASDLERLYEQEESPRWKAWYDLSYGRLLAMSVRHLEYLLACQAVLETDLIQPTTNSMQFDPSPDLRSGSEGARRAAKARQLLERCCANNPGTPWEAMAQWELQHGLGISIRQGAIPEPPPRPRVPRPRPNPQPVITFPNL